MATINEEAIAKLEKERNAATKLSKHGMVVVFPVFEALKQFCSQNSEFAQAVVQSSKTFKECVESTVKGVVSAISDIDVYRKAVEFYFSGATVHFNMTIDLGDNGFSNAPLTEAADKPSSGLSLSLDDLLL